ncbi:hypothetical protein [Jeotgalibacillus marinus]|uniref:Permease n=1 Tax=Jeotgalibacillus marinus TaxID=86667 RepID=A0ABV3Q6R0_9BACL
MNRNLFLICGVFFFLMFILMIGSTFIAGDESFNYNSLIFLSMAILSLSQYYMFPHLKENDERSKEIKLKSIFYSNIVFAGLMVLILLILTINLISIEAVDLLKLMIALFIVISPILMILISKRT